ncbi:hypothetical protein C8Q75DRAFT_226404 [Abortiporus biennis]|nr:hypothetical protein C8Q75DRAFT_226404 [Abortiporus biennis]
MPKGKMEEDSASDSESDNTFDDDDEDIRGRLEHILYKNQGKNAKASGSFAFSRVCPEAPNPILQVKDLGVIGLPLNPREAEVFKEKAQKIKEVKPTGYILPIITTSWEIDSSKITIGSKNWPIFMENVAKEVCQALGIDYDSSRPRCELFKLILFDEDTICRTLKTCENQEGTFATINVTLPSEFSGGETYLSHGGSLSTTYDCSAFSASETTIISWYTDVHHEFQPILKGYKLALQYNLVHTTTSPLPTFSASIGNIEELRSIFTHWSTSIDDGDYSAPEKILILLDHKYSRADLRGSALKGRDAHKIGLLQPIMKDLNFRLGLACVTMSIYGGSHDDDDRIPDKEWDWSDFEFLDAAELKAVQSKTSKKHNEEDASTESTFRTRIVVDLDGNKLSDNLDVALDNEDGVWPESDRDNEVIPRRLYDKLEKQSADKVERYRGYTGYDPAGSIKWYRRVFLVLWPEQGKLQESLAQKFNAKATIATSNEFSTAGSSKPKSKSPRKKQTARKSAGIGPPKRHLINHTPPASKKRKTSDDITFGGEVIDLKTEDDDDDEVFESAQPSYGMFMNDAPSSTRLSRKDIRSPSPVYTTKQTARKSTGPGPRPRNL